MSAESSLPAQSPAPALPSSQSPTAGAAPSDQPGAGAPSGAKRSFDDIVAAATATETPQTPAEAGPTGQTQGDPAAAGQTGQTGQKPEESASGKKRILPRREFKPQSLNERLAAKKAREAELQRLQPQEQQLSERSRQLEERERQLSQQFDALSRRDAEVQSAIKAGNLDAYLKSVGFEGGVIEYQRQVLKAKGLLEQGEQKQTTPKAEEKTELELPAEIKQELAELKKFRESQAEREKREAQEREQSERQRVYENDLKVIEQSVQQLDFDEDDQKQINELVKIPGVTPRIYSLVAQAYNSGEQIELEQIVSDVYQDYRELTEQLVTVFGLGNGGPDRAGVQHEPASPAGSPRPDVQAARGGQAPPQNLPLSTAAEVSEPQVPKNRDERFDFILQKAAQAAQAQA